MAPLSSGYAQLRMKCIDCGKENMVFLKKLLKYSSYKNGDGYRCHNCANMELKERPEFRETLIKAAHRSKEQK